MALSKLGGDAQGIIFGQLCNPLEPSLAVFFSSANRELRLLLTPALQQQLKAAHEAAVALCHKMGMRSCKELREATNVELGDQGLSEANLATPIPAWPASAGISVPHPPAAPPHPTLTPNPNPNPQPWT